MCNGVRASSTVFLFDTSACINIYSELINTADFYKRTFQFVYKKKEKEKTFHFVMNPPVRPSDFQWDSRNWPSHIEERPNDPLTKIQNNIQHRLSGPVIVIAVMFLSRNKFFHQHLGLNSLFHSDIVAFEFKTFICQKVCFRKLLDSSYFDGKWRSFRILYDD